MINQLNRVKSEVCLRGKKLKELAKKLDIDYNNFTRIINGYQKVPVDFYQKIEIIFDQWKKEDK